MSLSPFPISDATRTASQKPLPNSFILQPEGKESTIEALSKFSCARDIKLIQIDTAVFSYEPVLRAPQEITTTPLAPELVTWQAGASLGSPPRSPFFVIHVMRTNSQQDLRQVINTPKSIILDQAQAASLLSGLTQRVAIIQGPPGKRYFVHR